MKAKKLDSKSYLITSMKVTSMKVEEFVSSLTGLKQEFESVKYDLGMYKEHRPGTDYNESYSKFKKIHSDISSLVAKYLEAQVQPNFIHFKEYRDIGFKSFLGDLSHLLSSLNTSISENITHNEEPFNNSNYPVVRKINDLFQELHWFGNLVLKYNLHLTPENVAKDLSSTAGELRNILERIEKMSSGFVAAAEVKRS